MQASSRHTRLCAIARGLALAAAVALAGCRAAPEHQDRAAGTPSAPAAERTGPKGEVSIGPILRSPSSDSTRWRAFVAARRAQLGFCYGFYGIWHDTTLASELEFGTAVGPSGRLEHVAVRVVGDSSRWRGPFARDVTACLRDKVGNWRAPTEVPPGLYRWRVRLWPSDTVQWTGPRVDWG